MYRSPYHKGRFTIRTDNEVKNSVIKTVYDTANITLDLLRISEGHLFITIVNGDTIYDPNSEQHGFGCYEKGRHQIWLAGLELKDKDYDFKNEIICSTCHEIVHYWQDIQGRLEGSDENEKEAEDKTKEFFWGITK